MNKFSGFLAFGRYCLDKDRNDEYGKLSKQPDASGKEALKRGQLAQGTSHQFQTPPLSPFCARQDASDAVCRAQCRLHAGQAQRRELNSGVNTHTYKTD